MDVLTRSASRAASAGELTEAYHRSGLALLRQGRVEEATLLLQQGVASARGDLRLRRDLALAHLTGGRPVEAVRLLFDLLDDDPNNFDVLLALGDCYLAGGDPAAAGVFYEHAGRRQPDSPKVRARCALAAEAPADVRETWLAESPSPSQEGLETPGSGEAGQTGGLPLGARAVRAHLESLHPGQSPYGADMRRAAALLDEIMRAPDPAAVVRARLGEVLASLPLWIGLSASQARSEGDLHRAQTLARLAEQAAA